MGHRYIEIFEVQCLYAYINDECCNVEVLNLRFFHRVQFFRYILTIACHILKFRGTDSIYSSYQVSLDFVCVCFFTCAPLILLHLKSVCVTCCI